MAIKLHELLANAKVYDLGQPYWNGMPVHPFDPPFQNYLYRYHEYVKKDFENVSPGFAGAISLMITSPHSGTHFDAPIHMSQDLKVMGIDICQYQSDNGFTNLPAPLHAMEKVPPLILRSVLLDIPAYKGLDILPESYVITPEDLQGAFDAQQATFNFGDCLLIRTGYARYFETDADVYLHKRAGLSAESATWVANKQPKLFGIDNLSIGVPRSFDCHRIILVESGIYTMKSLNLEALANDKVYEMTTITLPLKVKGAEASLIRPVAVV